MPFGHLGPPSRDQRVLPISWINKSPFPPPPRCRDTGASPGGEAPFVQTLGPMGCFPFSRCEQLGCPVGCLFIGLSFIIDESIRPDGQPGRAQSSRPRPSSPSLPHRTGGLGSFLPGRQGQGAHRPAAASGLPLPAPKGLPAPSLVAAGLHCAEWPSHSLSAPVSQGPLQRAQSEEKSRWQRRTGHVSGPPCILLGPALLSIISWFCSSTFQKNIRLRLPGGIKSG